MKKLVRILPFMDNEEIKELANQIINEEVKGVRLVLLFPFLSNSDLDEIVDVLIEKKDGKQLQHAIPFASRETVDKIYKAVQAGDIKGIKESFLFPFLGKDQLKSMFKIFVEQAKNESEDESNEETHIHFHKHRDDFADFDIDLEDDEIDLLQINKLKEEMKELKKQLKEYKVKEKEEE